MPPLRQQPGQDGSQMCGQETVPLLGRRGQELLEKRPLRWLRLGEGHFGAGGETLGRWARECRSPISAPLEGIGGKLGSAPARVAMEPGSSRPRGRARTARPGRRASPRRRLDPAAARGSSSRRGSPRSTPPSPFPTTDAGSPPRTFRIPPRPSWSSARRSARARAGCAPNSKHPALARTAARRSPSNTAAPFPRADGCHRARSRAPRESRPHGDCASCSPP
jgi:hypothetical protein